MITIQCVKYYFLRKKKHTFALLKTQMMKKLLIYIAFATFALTSCGHKMRRPDTSSCPVHVSIKPFYQDLFSTADSSVAAKARRLSTTYGRYFDAYCSGEIRIGMPSDDDFGHNLSTFLSQKENGEVLLTCDSVFSQHMSDESDRLSDALSCMKYYFPDINIPDVYAHFSGFNNKIFIDSTYMSISIEHYLGADCRYYPWLEIPKYACKNKNPHNISSDLTKAWLYANFPDRSEKDDILTHMIYQGKILYALWSCMPDLSRHEVLGMTTDEVSWCQKAEQQMWGYMAEQRLLYSTNPLDKNKLINEAPFTVYFSDKSPGRAVLYCALHIIESYMETHPDVSLHDLLLMADAQQILMDAHYRP